MIIQRNIPLKQYNTFGIEAVARDFVRISSVEELQYLINKGFLADKESFVLGGGSNILLTGDYQGLVIRNEIAGIAINDAGGKVIVKAGAGVVWDDLVHYCIDHGFGGIENLVLIPGSVGAAPIQNIGAYGVELKDHFESLEAVSVEDGSVQTFFRDDCNFGYRESVFKNEMKGKFVITSVSLKLEKDRQPDVTYGAIREELQRLGFSERAGIQEVAAAIASIRRSKLPDPGLTGNAGSFFKNPVIPFRQYADLKFKYPDIPSYPAGQDLMKVPAGWLIEKCGWKGRQVGRAGVHARQALVIVNHGGATGEEILALAQMITENIEKTFGIALEKEVNVI